MPNTTQRLRHGHGVVKIILAVGLLLGLYLLATYVFIPALWRRAERAAPPLASSPARLPTITHTGAGIPGDPINIAIIGAEHALVRGMLAAGWHPADPITLRSCEKIIMDTLLHRPYEGAPVSNLYLFDRKEDLAFEKPVGDDPKQRHHVRYWLAIRVDYTGLGRAPLWLGAATFDHSIGFSHDTGQITHHIAPEVDAERDLIVRDLQAAQRAAAVTWVQDFQPHRTGHNGGGDPWETDGRLAVVTLTQER